MKINSTVSLNFNDFTISNLKLSQDDDFLDSVFENTLRKAHLEITDGPSLDINIGSLDSGINISTIKTTYTINNSNTGITNNTTSNNNSNNDNTINDSNSVQNENNSNTIQNENNSNINSDMDLTPSKVNYSSSSVGSYDTTKPNPSIDEINSWVEKYSKKYSIDSDLVKAIIKTESSFNNQSISCSGAVGLMQLMPSAAKEMGLTVNSDIDERWNPEKNIEAGIKYLTKYHDIISEKLGTSNWDYAIGGYNVGPYEIINKGYITSTAQKYVDKVNKYYKEFKQ